MKNSENTNKTKHTNSSYTKEQIEILKALIRKGKELEGNTEILKRLRLNEATN